MAWSRALPLLLLAAFPPPITAETGKYSPPSTRADLWHETNGKLSEFIGLNKEKFQDFVASTGLPSDVLSSVMVEMQQMRRLGGVANRTEEVVSIVKLYEEEKRGQISAKVPRYRRMVVYDQKADEYRMVRAQVDQTVDEMQIVETSTHLKLRINSGEHTHNVFVTVSIDYTGRITIIKYHSTVEEVSDRNAWRVIDTEHASKYSDGHVDCMSVNLWNFNHWAPRIPLLQNVFIDTLPDIIGFQEIRSCPVCESDHNTHQIKDLSKLLPGFQFIHQPAMLFHQGDHLHHEGLAIFSRFPILDTDYIKLSRDPSDGGDFHQRLCLRALISTPLGKLNVFVTHLSLSKDARIRTMEEIGEYVTGFSGPSILMGDFNAEMQREMPTWPSDWGLKDAWRVLNRDEKGYTFSSWVGKSRIDYIYTKDVDLLQTSIEGTEPIESSLPPVGGIRDMKGVLYPSDHMFPFVRVR
ncbi:hypothetical protein AAMO2058_000884900 [Amorphochlora amoebiformis]